MEDIQIKITPELQKSGTLRGWSAFSPDTLIHRYGQPSHVELFADWGPRPFFGMQMYFDDFDLIVQYSGVEIIPSQKGSSQICPLTAQFDSVWLWMGENPQDPPGPGVSLEKATSLTVVEFSNLMIGAPDQACFIFNGDVYE